MLLGVLLVHSGAPTIYYAADRLFEMAVASVTVYTAMCTLIPTVLWGERRTGGMNPFGPDRKNPPDAAALRANPSREE